MLIDDFIVKMGEVYGGYPPELVAVLGWGMAGALVVLAIVLAMLPWNRNVAIKVAEDELTRDFDDAFAGKFDLDDVDGDGFDDTKVPPGHVPGKHAAGQPASTDTETN